METRLDDQIWQWQGVVVLSRPVMRLAVYCWQIIETHDCSCQRVVPVPVAVAASATVKSTRYICFALFLNGWQVAMA